MAGYIALLVTTITLTGLFAIIIASADIEEIKNNWAERRCEVPVVIASGLFKPAGDSRSSTDFAQDNFKFCVKNLADEVIKIAFAPLYGVLGQQMNVQSTMSGPMNSIRGLIAQGMKTFSNLLDTQYRQYKAIFIHATKTWHHIHFAMGRIGAIVTAIVYFGISASFLVQNTMKLIMNVMLIFLGIMIAMMILIWFGLIPFLGIIITTLSVLVAADIETGGWVTGGGNGMAGAFCIDPDANVKLNDGSTKPLKDIKLGDILLGTNNIVTGILCVDASKESIVEIEGVRMSDSHRVLYEDKWILAKEHPLQNHAESMKELICLNTTQHSVPIESITGTLHLGDWEEISSESERKEWINWVYKTLNKTKIKTNIYKYPTTVPLCSPTVKVITQDGCYTQLDKILIGDLVLSDKSYTKVIGIYKGTITISQDINSPDWISDGVWMKANDVWNICKFGIHNDSNGIPVYGMCLVTESGTMFIKETNGSIYIIRDFTEVGASNISKSYSWLDNTLNKKSMSSD